MKNQKKHSIYFLLSFLAVILLTLPASGQNSSDWLSICIEPDLNSWDFKGPKFKSKWVVGISEKSPRKPTQLKVATDDGNPKELINKAKGGIDIYTKKSFGDCTVELEVKLAEKGNSGIYLMGQYEVQVKDSYGKSRLLADDDMGGIIGTSKPLKNAAKKQGEWQKYVIEFKAPRFENGKRVAPAEFVKVVLNDVVVQEHIKMAAGPTSGSLRNGEYQKGPLMLQGGLGAVAYRNIRILKSFPGDKVEQ